ncbi:6072_t:CDS:2, partial [Gigaspora margarita]
MSKQSKQPTKRSARLLQCTNKPELESLVHDKPQEHQLFLLPQPLVSIELSEPSQVQKDVTSLIQENNVNTNRLLSELVERHPNIHLLGRLSQMLSESSDIIKSKDFDRIKEENRQLRKKVDNLETDKLLKLPVKAFNISNKNEKSYFYVDEDEERNKETTQLRQASNKKAEHEKIVSDNDDSDSKGARLKELLHIPSWAYITSESEDEKVSETSSKRRRVTDYDRSIMYSRNSELETGESSTI